MSFYVDNPAIAKKYVGESVTYTIEWSGVVGEDNINSSTWTMTPTGLTEDEKSIDGTQTLIRISGGASGQWFTVANTIQTVGGLGPRTRHIRLFTA